MDGVLLDSVDILVQTFQETGRKLGFQVPHQEEVKSLIGRSREEILDQLYGSDLKTGPTFDKIYRIAEKKITIMDGVQEVLTAIKLPKAIVTSKKANSTRKQLGKIVQSFEVLVAQEDTHLHKPHPAPLLLACKKLGVEPAKTVYVGDTLTDFHAAREANTYFIGFLSGCVTMEAFETAGVGTIITNLHVLPQILDVL